MIDITMHCYHKYFIAILCFYDKTNYTFMPMLKLYDKIILLY